MQLGTFVRFLCTIVIIILMLTGCQMGLGKKDDESIDVTKLLKPLAEGEQATIKVMYFDERSFMQMYGTAFSVKYPNITLEYVPLPRSYPEPDPKKAMLEWFAEVDADIIFPPFYEDLYKEGLLLNLEPLIKQDKFDLSNIHPSVTETIRQRSGGKLHGLAPGFTSQALYYNQDLFDQYHISYPKDKMSWEEVITLARKFPAAGSEDRPIYGYYADAANLFYLISNMANTHGLLPLTQDARTMALVTPEWKSIWNLFLSAHKQGFLALRDYEFQEGSTYSYNDVLRANHFRSGRAAMTIGSSSLISTLEMDARKATPFKWNIVTVPVDAARPNESASYFINEIFSISSNSPNKRAAWTFLTYIHSAEFAKIAAKTSSSMLLSRVEFNENRSGLQMDAFYKLKPSSKNITSLSTKAPPGFMQKYNPLVIEEIDSVVGGRKTVDEALKSLQERGQQILTQEK